MNVDELSTFNKHLRDTQAQRTCLSMYARRITYTCNQWSTWHDHIYLYDIRCATPSFFSVSDEFNPGLKSANNPIAHLFSLTTAHLLHTYVSVFMNQIGFVTHESRSFQISRCPLFIQESSSSKLSYMALRSPWFLAYSCTPRTHAKNIHAQKVAFANVNIIWLPYFHSTIDFSACRYMFEELDHDLCAAWVGTSRNARASFRAGLTVNLCPW